MILWIALTWLATALSLKLRRKLLAPWISLLLLAAPPIPATIGIIALIAQKNLFATSVFTRLFTVGATGFCVTLTNATLWLFLARRWTHQNLRPTAAPASTRVLRGHK